MLILLRILLCSIFLFVILFCFFQSSYASVILNEVAIQPNQVVELYNNASESADISSWYIDDAGGTTYYTIPSQTILPPLSCLVFTADFNFNRSSSDVIRLFDSTNQPISSSAKLIESYIYTKAPEAGYSFSKKMDGGTEWQTVTSSLGLLNESLMSCIPTATPTPTPTEAPSPIPTTIPTPTTILIQTTTQSVSDYPNIFISEVYPYPQTGEKEWVEIYNGNDMQVNLGNWYIDDSENSGSSPKSFSIQLNPYAYGIIEMSSSLFNNSGDVVRLLNKVKMEKDTMEYGAISQGKSIGRISFEEDIYCEQEQSKNTANSSCILKPTPISTAQNITKNVSMSTQKNPSPIKKVLDQKQMMTNGVSLTNLALKGTILKQREEVLGIHTRATTISPIQHLSFVSFSYSLLTIVSIFIKMKNA